MFASFSNLKEEFKMIINELGAEFEYNGVTYVIGEPIIGTKESEYEGLFGTITEIRDGSDKDTDNETPDLYCEFEDPILPSDVTELEKTFSDLYGEPKKLEDIILDSVIMAPNMIMPLAELKRENIGTKVYVLREEWAKDDDYGQKITVFSDKFTAKIEMLKQLKEEMDDGLVAEFKDMDGFNEETYDCYYECFVEPQAEANHYSISVTEQEIIMSRAFINNLKDCNPDCFKPEPNNPYPLCLGAGKEECETCCLYLNMSGEGGLE